MADIYIKLKCSRCRGTGIDDNDKDEQGNPIPHSCVPCEGEGWKRIEKLETDDLNDRFSDIDDKLVDVTEKLIEIKEVVDAL